MSRDPIKKTKVVPFIGTKGENPNWTQIKKSTAFTLSMNPQTKTYDFISSEQPETEIDSYQPSLAQSLTMFKGEPDYQTIFDMLYNRATGDDAHRPVLIAFIKETASYTPTVGEDPVIVYKGWLVDAVVAINQMDTVNENIDFDLNFNDITEGAITLSGAGVPTFIAGTFSDGTFTPAE